MNEKMIGLWIFNLILIFVTMYTVRPDRHWITGQSLTPVSQPDKELSVDIGGLATLQCCVSKKLFQMIYLFKQPNREKPRLIVKVFKTGGETFYNGFQKSRFQIEISVNCFNMTILNIIQSDEATYYCALMEPHIVFGDGTYLKTNGRILDHVTVSLETSKPVLRNNSVVCEPTLNENSTNMTTQEKTVLSLGTALSLCALLILCLTFFLLIRNKHDKKNTSMENSLGIREVCAETLNYAAVKFPQRKVNAEKRTTSTLTECVYSDVKCKM
ncbi:uncharacterized protein LOC128531703 [Clarias gariepinus]|uniref:uncharacterized protein LOC128531703 n=1 Tax=Clarias gariepinus TaxID=13013 RepID=UPI00234C8CD4|nr:uncharacterized protein LOC128531703 [Clarias gariepinus]